MQAIVDLSKVNETDFRPLGNPHKPLKPVCPDIWMNFGTLPLGFYHYLGSWEAYSYRDDSRDGYLRSHDKWQAKAVLKAGGPDDFMRPWISRFVDLVGEEKAKSLLQDAGLPRDYRSPYNGTASNVPASRF